MRKVYFFLFVLTLLFARTSTGQILKTDRVSVRTDTAKAVLGSLTAGFDYQDRSRSDSEKNISKTLDINSDLAVLLENWAIVFINQLNYLSVSDAEPLSTGYSHLRLIFDRKSKLSPELFTQVQYDETRTMAFRFLQGAGIKWTPIDTDNFDLHMGPGIMWEQETWDPEGVPETTKNLWKSTNYIGINTRLTKNIQLHLINYYQVGKDSDVWRHRISGDLWTELEINSHFSLVSKLSIQYENAPVIDIRKSVILFSSGLQLNL